MSKNQKVNIAIILGLILIISLSLKYLLSPKTRYSQKNIKSLISLENKEDIGTKRKAVISYIFKQEKLPLQKKPQVKENIQDKCFKDLKNLKQINKLTINMEYKVNSIVYHFIPEKSNHKLIVYHQGHRGGFILGYNIIEEFLKREYSVIAFSMPLKGMNNQPEIEIEGIGKTKLTKHNHFKQLDSKNFSALKFFIEPIVITLNYADKINYQQIDMLGISGGGWTTVVASAIDTRISKSYPVAGSYPLYLRSEKYGKNEIGDYEQREEGLYKTASYLELYLLGAHGKNRKQIQVLNVYDSECFSGRRYLSYQDIIYKKAKDIGNTEFSIFADKSHKQHKISQKALEFIINDLEE